MTTKPRALLHLQCSCALGLMLGVGPALAQQPQESRQKAQQEKNEPQGQSEQQQQQKTTETNQEQQNEKARITRETSVDRSGRALTANERTRLSRAAALVLRHVENSRKEIRSGNKEAAKTQLGQAMDALKVVENAAPSFQVYEKIQSGEFIYEDRDKIKAKLIPIYTELEESSFIAPIDVARSHGGEKDRSGSQSRSRSEQDRTRQGETSGPAVKHAEVEYTVVALDIENAMEHLKAAQQALADNQTQQADAALAAIQAGTVTVRMERDAPLVKARQNLVLARAMLQQNRPDDAKAALRQAADALENYSSRSSDKQSEIKNVAAEIRQFSANLGENKDEAANKIENWWNQVADVLG